MTKKIPRGLNILLEKVGFLSISYIRPSLAKGNQTVTIVNHYRYCLIVSEGEGQIYIVLKFFT